MVKDSRCNTDCEMGAGGHAGTCGCYDTNRLMDTFSSHGEQAVYAVYPCQLKQWVDSTKPKKI
jgi:hypothetical protein